jgi:hypothetical protein
MISRDGRNHLHNSALYFIGRNGRVPPGICRLSSISRRVIART